MASTTVNATLQGRAEHTLSAALIAWVSQVRNGAGTAAYTYTTNISDASAMRAYLLSGRTGYLGACYRTMLFFGNLDTATGGGTITAATLKVYNNLAGSSTDTIVIKASAWGGGGDSTTLSASDYANVDHSTAYSSKDLSWGGATYNDFALNATAISDMNTNGYLNCAVIEGDYDYDGDGPTLGTDVSARVEFLDATNPIQLELTYSAAGYGNDVIGVSSDTIGEVIGVATANIGKIIGVS